MASGATQWEGLRREARTIENGLEADIHSFSKLCSNSEPPPEEMDEENGLLTKDEQELKQKIDVGIAQFLNVTNRMSTCVSTSATKAQTATIQRNREILHDFQSEFRKLSSALVRKRESAELFRRMNGETAGANATSMEPLLRERNSLNNSHRMLDDVLGQAFETRDDLGRQGRLMKSSSSGLSAIASRFPTINSIMNTIQRKKARENLVLAVVIAACIMFTLWYLFG